MELSHRGCRRFSLRGLPLPLRAAVATLAAALVVSGAFGPAAAGARTRSWQVSAWTFGDRPSLRTAVAAGVADEVQPDWYAVTSDGALAGATVDPVFVQFAHTLGCRVLATVSNYDDGFSPDLAHAVLASTEARRTLVTELLAACATIGFDGVDLDFENVPEGDRDLLSSFVEELAAALHDRSLKLGMAVYPKTTEPGDWSGARAEDYARLGAAADELQVMTYGYRNPWTGPGPIAPPRWMDRALDFAVTQVDPAKVWMGVPFYGGDWWHDGAELVVWNQAVARREAHHARVARTASGEARFSYRDGRGRHTVYFQDRAALAAKLDVLTRRHPDLAGIAVWVMGGEDPRFWPEIAARLTP